MRARTDRALVDAGAQADGSGEPVLLVGGGSNILAADHGFDGAVVHVATSGIEVRGTTGDGAVLVEVAAGESWDATVAWSVSRGLAGLETLSGIPGTTMLLPRYTNTVITHTRKVTKHLYANDQFFGFSGSRSSTLLVGGAGLGVQQPARAGVGRGQRL